MKEIILWLTALAFISCNFSENDNLKVVFSDDIEYMSYSPKTTDISLSRIEYYDKLYGFWLGQCIANWTGLITEMDKIGTPVNGRGGGFYTREDWGKPDQPNLWGSSEYSETITYIYAEKDSIWGADDDTDIEYIYQELLYNSPSLDLTGEQIRNAWLNHIHLDEENFLWVSNQKAFVYEHHELRYKLWGSLI